MPKIVVHPWNDPVWKGFARTIEEDDEHIEYDEPGDLAVELAEHCSRDETLDLDAQKVMYMSEISNQYLELLDDDGNRIGFMLLDLPDYGKEAKIVLLCVSKSEKGKQSSRILIDEAKRLAKKAGKERLTLEAYNRTVGEKVYAKQGFRFVTERGEDMVYQIAGSRKRKTRRRKRRSFSSA